MVLGPKPRMALLAVAVVIGATLGGAPAAARADVAPAGVVTSYHDPTINGPKGIVVGPDGALWFTNIDGNSIGRITTGAVVSNFTDPTINAPFRIVSGPDGALWFTNYDGNSIGRITTAGVVSNFTDPTIRNPKGITAGPDGALWFTNRTGNSIGRITTGGIVSSFTDPTIVHPEAIVVGPDGALWFTNYDGNSIGRITTTGIVSKYTASSVKLPKGITAGPDGALWFINEGNNSIGRITTTGVISNFTDPTIDLPFSITVGPDGALWFTNHNGDSIGRITTAGVVTAYADPSIAAPHAIAAGPDGALWFTNYATDSIGRLTTPFTVAAPSADLVVSATASTRSVGADATVVLHVTAKNNGPGPVTAAALATGFPLSVQPVTAAPSQGSCALGRPVTCALGPLANGASATVDITVRPILPAKIMLATTAASEVSDPNAANNSATAAVTVTAAAKTNYVTVSDTGVTPRRLTVAIGTAVQWDFLGSVNHDVTDDSGMHLFTSGPVAPGGYYSTVLPGAGGYAYTSTEDEPAFGGTIDVTPTITPASGSTTTTFTVTWAKGAPPAGYVFDAQIRRPGTGYRNYETALTAPAATYTPDAGPGAYTFRIRLRHLGDNAAGQYRATQTVTVS